MDRRSFITGTAAFTAIAGTSSAAASQSNGAPFVEGSPEARMGYHLMRIEDAVASARAELLRGGGAVGIQNVRSLSSAIEVSAIMIRSDRRGLDDIGPSFREEAT